MITQTHIFSAAMLGAPVVNMFSAYGGIRWGSGLARAFQYETGQSRIGESIWEAPMRYLENSPLFWLDKVTTPVFFMHNDADDAVPWYQGIEAFVALRRLGKEVYLINYNNDVHNPQSRANQKDMAMRMEQFFDHHLRGKPAPEWMKKGVPYLAKGRDQVAGSEPVQTGSTGAQVPERKN
jgi:dipeptidyl aminopeptidase/acylaminoacyl peptidase